MINKKAVLPNFFTLTSLFLGFLAIIKISQGYFTTAAWFIIIATFCDSVDGKLARWSKSYSNFGKQFDSLADGISFGVAPAFLLYETSFGGVGMWGAIFCFIFILAGVFRLARYNVETSDYKKEYKGLPIPVAALALATFFIMSQHFWDTVSMAKVLLVLVPSLSFLMISSINFATIPSLRLQRNMRRNIKPITYYVGFACILYNPQVWFFPWTMVYIFVESTNGFLQKLHENDEELEVPIDEEKNIN